jgi:hypothetical protein
MQGDVPDKPEQSREAQKYLPFMPSVTGNLKLAKGKALLHEEDHEL